MSGIEILDRGDRDKLSAERRLFVIIGIALTQHSGTHHTQENEENEIQSTARNQISYSRESINSDFF